MIEEALIVAELDTALYRQHNRWHAVRKENGKLIDCARELSALLAHPAEKRQLSPTPANLKALMDCLTAWGMRHELLQLLLMGMDAVCSDDTRLAALELAEKLLEQAEVANFARARLFGCPLPAVADLDTAVKLAHSLPKTQSLYQDLQQAQGIIPVVRRTLENLLRFDFELSCAADDLLPAMVNVGLVAAAVNALSHQDKNQVEELLFTFTGNQTLKTLEPRLSQLLTLFIKQLLMQFTVPAKAVIAPTTRYDDDPIAEAIEAWKTELKQQKKPDKHKKTADQSRQNNDKQKDYIIKLIQQGKHAQTQTALREMVLNHRQTGDLKHLCKSLSDLAARTVALGQPELAVDFYHYAKLANNLDVVVYSGYAETLRALNRLDEALAAYAAAKQQFPKDVFCHTGYAETLRALNHLDEALTAYEEAKEQFPENAVCHSGYAETLRALNRPEDALAAYAAAKQQFPKDVFCHNGYAESLRALNRLDDALTAYAAAKKQFPNNAVCHTGYAETLRALNRLDEALTAYDEAKQQFPKDVFCHTGHAETLRALNRLDEAFARYAVAKKQFPSNAVCHTGYAETLRALNRLDEALTAYEEAKQQFPKDVFCHTGYAETLRALNRLDEALTAYEEAKKLFPNDAVCHTGYAETLRALNRLDVALTAYEEAKDRFPGNAVCHTGYAEILRAMGRTQLALQAYDGAQLLFPNDPVLPNAKACLLISLERYPEARALLSVYGLDSERAYRDYHVLAMSYFYEGDFTTAETMLRRGVKDALGLSKAVFESALAVLFIKQHKANEVLQLWQSKVVSRISLPQQSVVYAHALAECHYLKEADAQLKQLEKPPTPVFELSQFLQQRYWSANSPAEQAQLDETIFRRELDLMLYAA
ncbi:MAG: tetratricopeptide repeat protein [Methylococcales bacterium]|nr:tetratricopeptide repeat protein [Methylococcales bacterium]